MVIMRRFKTHSASSTTNQSSSLSSSRKSSSVTGLFKSASSPTPPTNFVSNSSTESPPPAATSYHQRSAALIRSYGRAINRSFQSSIGYMSGHGSSNQQNSSENSLDIPDTGADGLLVVDTNASTTGNVASSSGGGIKSPLSPKLPSRFKFSKSKSKSREEQLNTVAKQELSAACLPSKVAKNATANNHNKVPLNDAKNNETAETNNVKPVIRTVKTKQQTPLTSTKTLNQKNNKKPILIRQHSDEHQLALLERAYLPQSAAQQGQGKKSSDDVTNKLSNATTKKDKSSSNKTKSTGKLRKMVALEIAVPNDIVYEEGDSNKVVSIFVYLAFRTAIGKGKTKPNHLKICQINY